VMIDDGRRLDDGRRWEEWMRGDGDDGDDGDEWAHLSLVHGQPFQEFSRDQSV
jgi:hypothetical protein